MTLQTQIDRRAWLSGGWLAAAGALGLIAVAAGAFGAHALKDRLDPGMLAAFEVAVRYQMYHAIALLGLAILQAVRPGGGLRAVGVCWLIGVVLFSGGIYGLTLLKWRWLAPVTPIGGTIMMLGWLMLLVIGLRSKQKVEEKL